jgi:hypothetical protein
VANPAKVYDDATILSTYKACQGNIRATAKALGRPGSRFAIRERLRKLGAYSDKPLVSGSIQGHVEKTMPLPRKGEVKRYILTSAQNNTYVHEAVWNALTALRKHYDAQIMIGTFSYNQNSYGKLAVKRGTQTQQQGEHELWFDSRIEPYFTDHRVVLAPGLVWCGEMNILPTAVNPLAGLESYSLGDSAIFPHTKLAMRSVASTLEEPAKLIYTTGTVTQRNYIQKRMGLIAEFHHVYGGLLVEVNHEGRWWVRQLNISGDGTLQDLDVVVKDGKVTTGNAVEGVTWGDLHGTMIDPEVMRASLDMLDALHPKFQFLHDVMEGISFNRHVIKNGATNDPHYNMYRWMRGLHRVDEEFRQTAHILQQYMRPWCKAVAPDANHDADWLHKWLARYDYKVDPANAEIFLDVQKYSYAQLRAGKMMRDVDLMGYVFKKFGIDKIQFLLPDQPFKICGGSIECGMHGHFGPNGKRGRPEDLSKMGVKAITAHTHCAGIFDGLYVAGTSSKLVWSYNLGPSAWVHAHVVTYPNGKRAIVTISGGKWRA